MTRSEKILVAYDDACSACTAWTVRLARWDRVGRFELVGLSQAASQIPLAEVPHARLLERLHVAAPDGRLFVGSRAVAYVLRQFLLTWPFGAALCLPGIKYIAERFYDGCARHRKRSEDGHKQNAM